ncbi:Bestrophin and Zinc finger and RNA recognition motif domain containing protein [Aphelenchoides besseyi]|nr:Bestrophin and Zinc finger and RNA recognition motif domain containing protein [Aphelenchoides besseyi]
MTVQYNKIVATAHSTSFIRLLFRWYGSVWKGIHVELFTWLAYYMVISCTYRFVLRDTATGLVFEKLVQKMDGYLKQFSGWFTFVLGLYVSAVAARWSWVFYQLPWPDNFFSLLSAFFESKGHDYKATELNLRMTISRYWNAVFILILRDISESARKRFPTLQHLVPLVLTIDEVEIIERIENSDEFLYKTCLYWVPLEWIAKLLKKARSRGNLSDLNYTILNEELSKLRECFNNLLSQDFLSAMPLSYTQIVSFAPVVYFVLNLFGKQFVPAPEGEPSRIDYIFPFNGVYEFIIYYGWLKVGQVMLNAFGLDPDDYEIDWLVQRNYQIGRLILNRLFDQTPKIMDVEMGILPHTKASAKNMRRASPMVGSMAKVVEERSERRDDVRENNKFSSLQLRYFGKTPTADQLPPVAPTPKEFAPVGRRSEVVVEFLSPTQILENDGAPKTQPEFTPLTDQKPDNEATTQKQTPQIASSVPLIKTDPTQNESVKDRV